MVPVLRGGNMKRVYYCILLCVSLLMTSCATLIPPRHPDLSREEFQGMVSGSSEKTLCYESGFRGGMLFLDFVLGTPFLWVPIVIDGVGGKFTAYYYDHDKCESLKAQERDARLSRDSGRDSGRNVEKEEPDSRPAKTTRKKVTKTVIIETTETDDDDEYEVLY